jgi:DNA-binding NtrC family response regulator
MNSLAEAEPVKSKQGEMRIFLVDDEKAVTDFLSTFLKMDGDFEVECAIDGNAAFQHYSEHGPHDLVVTDYVHPGMNGLELSRAIRKRNPTQAIAAFTGGRSKPTMHCFRRLHIPVLLKPSSAPEIVQFLKDAIANSPKNSPKRRRPARRR